MRILVVARSYPAPRDLYQYPFVHRRVLAYRRAGHDVAVFRPSKQTEPTSHEFESVVCLSGGRDAFKGFVANWRPDVVAAHGFSEQMWPVLEPVAGTVAMRAWLHGSEIPSFFREKANAIVGLEERSRALKDVETRIDFWKSILRSWPRRFGLVFVSQAAVAMARADLGPAFEDKDVRVIPNPIDTDLFSYRPKSIDDRWKVLTIRPYDSWTYGNDMAVEVIRRVGRECNGRASFTVIGDGPQFEETVAPLSGLTCIRIERRFLRQDQIAEEHRRHGIFLVPTRLDTQGVSRDEAMSSGLVPVTNAIPAVEEFVDPGCAALAADEDVEGLAAALREMLNDPGLFLARSAAAAGRIRKERGQDILIDEEIRLLESGARNEAPLAVVSA